MAAVVSRLTLSRKSLPGPLSRWLYLLDVSMQQGSAEHNIFMVCCVYASAVASSASPR